MAFVDFSGSLVWTHILRKQQHSWEFDKIQKWWKQWCVQKFTAKLLTSNSTHWDIKDDFSYEITFVEVLTSRKTHFSNCLIVWKRFDLETLCTQVLHAATAPSNYCCVKEKNKSIKLDIENKWGKIWCQHKTKKWSGNWKEL